MKFIDIRAPKIFLTCVVLFSFAFSTLASAASPNLALNQPVTASSSENSRLPPKFAVDANMNSRWSSDFSDNNWIAVDLGALYQITGVKFHWQNSYAKDYKIQTSNNGVNWVTIHTTVNNPGGVDEVTLEGTGRYVRMKGLRRATRYGYSMFNFEVYGHSLWTREGSDSDASTPDAVVRSPNSNAHSGGWNAWASVDSRAPTVPTNLRADKIDLTSVTLNWKAATDDVGVARYIVSRNGKDLVELKGSTQTYTDRGLRSATSYSYRVRAGDAAGNWSRQSSILALSTESPRAWVGGGVTLEWASPRARENGSYLELKEIGGYEIHYKHRAASKYQVLILEDATATEYRFGHLRGNHEFKIAVFDVNGLYSQFVKITPRRP